MATLVLTTVGGIVGGPVGAAIGGVLGQAVDRGVLFKPSRREGPRLADLSVQTSIYGAAIPKLFGTMRVAGTVIWSTDLIESRTTTHGGKGRPDTTAYSYSASFAVLLSGRAIRGVKRIWADGTLLRGAGGDFKTACTFRLHLGDEAQEVDPLIASAEGAALTPAHRGCAYAVFEDFALADYGNRIPSLSFEVEADAAPVTVGAIAAAVSDGVMADDGAGPALAGFSAYGDSVRAVLDTLATASGGWFAPAGATLAMRSDGAATATLDDAGVAAAGGARGVRSIAAISNVPKTVTIGYYDPARDYQTGLQQARRPGAGSAERRIEMPAVLDAGAAKTMAEAALARAEAGRETRTIAPGWSALGVAPGDVVAITGESGRWRVTGWSFEDDALMLDLTRLAAASVPASASPGRVLASPDLAIGQTVVHAFEAPPLDDAVLAAPRLLIAAAGTGPGWRKAALLLSTDNGASWKSIGATAAAAVLGTIAVPPRVAGATLVDRAGIIEVVLLREDMALADADAAMLAAGGNLALVGDELVQFGRAEPLGGARWRLSALWRGRRGTEAAAGAQKEGDRFVLLTADTVTTATLPLAAIGGTARLLASGVGDAEPAEARAPVSGASVLPPAPVHLSMRPLTGGDIALRWVRRSRAGWRWIDCADAPLAEEAERYRVTITPAGGTARTVETDTPALTLAAADRASGATVAVRQAGSNGLSPAATIVVPAPTEE